MKLSVALASVVLALACGPVPASRSDLDPPTSGDPTTSGGASRSDVDAPAVDEPAIDEEPIDQEPIDEEPIDEEPVDEAPVDEAPIDEPVDDPEEPAPVDVPPPADETGGGAPVDEATVAPTCSIVQRPARPATCPFGGNELVVWGQEGWNALADAAAADLSPCTDVFISIPPVTNDKTKLRVGQAALMRERGPQMHPMAEFHYGAWKQKKDAEGLTWLEVGRLFRDEMDAKGYCVEAGDTWAINEAPSPIRKDAAFREGFKNLLQGLAEGRSGSPFTKGALFITGMGHQTENVSVYKSNLKTWLQHTSFWTKANDTVRFFGQEVYLDPTFTCLGATAVVDRRRRVNDFAMHLVRLAADGPDSVNTAQSFLSRTYTPTMNAVWDATPDRGYGDTTIVMLNMQRFMRMQVDAARSFADGHASPDGRIGFAFASYHAPDEWDVIGTTLANAVRGAYGAGASAAGACTGEGCTCLVTGAEPHDTWAALGTW